MVAHRRCGKTVACVGDLIERALQTKPREGWAPGHYAYVGPYLGVQSRRFLERADCESLRL
jgi:hypothetical protein